MSNSYAKAVSELRKMDEEHGDVWKMPPYVDSLMFAMTEIGETMDAILRQKPEYFRNREFATTGNEVYEEAADVAMMLIKALMVKNVNFDYALFEAWSTKNHSLLNVLLKVASVIPVAIAMENSNLNLETEQDVETCAIHLIKGIDNEMSEGWFGNRIAEKMDKTRAKIAARKAQ